MVRWLVCSKVYLWPLWHKFLHHFMYYFVDIGLYVLISLTDRNTVFDLRGVCELSSKRCFLIISTMSININVLLYLLKEKIVSYSKKSLKVLVVVWMVGTSYQTFNVSFCNRIQLSKDDIVNLCGLQNKCKHGYHFRRKLKSLG